ncbi:MAG: hypothetical protein LKF36_12740 [Lactobacillus sp.]|nr:hypothetical protein [Lactobacillus sp.]
MKNSDKQPQTGLTQVRFYEACVIIAAIISVITVVLTFIYPSWVLWTTTIIGVIFLILVVLGYLIAHRLIRRLTTPVHKAGLPNLGFNLNNPVGVILSFLTYYAIFVFILFLILMTKF